MDDADFLPDDLAACQRLLLAAFKQSVELEHQIADAQRHATQAAQRVVQSEQRVAELSRVLDETAASYQELQQVHAATLDELAWYRRWTFGRRRERFAAGEGQGHLFELDSPLTGESPASAAPDPEAGSEVKAHRRRKKRQIDWDKLPQIRHNHNLEEEDKTCSCCGRPMKCIGEDVTRELEYHPAKLEAHIHVRPKYACPRCKDGVLAAPLPPRPIPGGIAGPGLITEVFVGKFGDHLPLYRLEDILARYGVYLSRSTLSDWMKAVAYLFRPLYELQRRRILQSSVMWTDDTHVTVLGGEQGSFKGYFWTYLGDQQHPYSVYDFTASRSRAGPTRFLEGYSGYLHADAYTGYDAMFLDVASGIIEVACWSHSRRKFFEAVPATALKLAECELFFWDRIMLTCFVAGSLDANREDMVMILGKVFERFARKSPVTVMLRGVLEHALPKGRIDELFRQHAVRQREDQLLFSSVVNVLALAVTGMRRSVNAAYEASAEQFTVSVRALYDKLQKSEPAVAQALVRDSAARLRPVLRAMEATSPPLLEGYRVKILDGKHLDGTERRIQETRILNSAPLPGNVLVVLDPELSLAIDAFPCEDAYAQERSLLPEVLETVEVGDLWIGDRNFCTTGFLFGLAERDAFFLIRQHGSNLSGKRPQGRKKRIGRCQTGMVYEQTLEIDDPVTKETMALRRITIVLDKPTRDGDAEIHLLTNLPEEEDAIKLAALYLERWKIENLFGELKQALDAEINTLCYPKAALLAFCVGLLTYNVTSVLKAALSRAHGEGAEIQRLSTYYLAEEIDAVYEGMMIAIPERTWTRTFGDLSPQAMAAILGELAGNTRIERFRKRQRSTRNPPPKRTGGLREKHVSTQRLLNQRT